MPNHFRARRHAQMLAMIEDLPRPVNILDVGGTMAYWRVYEVPTGACITLLNQSAPPVEDGFISVAGNACDLSRYDDGQFDLVFSNSVIEHVGSCENQAAMASEIRRVGRAYFVQAPYRHFPLECHFMLPFFQYWPRPAQQAWCKLRYRGERLDRALRALGKTHLPTVNDFRRWFPDATIQRERLAGLTKSLIALRL